MIEIECRTINKLFKFNFVYERMVVEFFGVPHSHMYIINSIIDTDRKKAIGHARFFSVAFLVQLNGVCLNATF